MSKIKILENVPWSNTGNIADAYNAFMEKLNDEDFAIFRDADTCYTTSDYGSQFYDIIDNYPGVRAFTCLTGRTNSQWQKLQNLDPYSDDYRYHRRVGEGIQKDYYGQCYDCTDQALASGHWFMIQKSLWREIGGASTKGMLGVDNDCHRRIRLIGERLYLAKGIYIYHYYSGFTGEGTRNTEHLNK